MMPSLELRLRTMAKAMTDVILPALAPENALAREQAQLVIAQLGMIAEHWRRAAEYDALAHREITVLAEQLCACADGGADTLAAKEALAALLSYRDGPPPDGVDASRASIAAAIDVLIRASAVDGTEGFRRESAAAIVEYSEKQSRRDRAWFAGFGMDPERAGLPSIDEMLAAARRSDDR